jgi:hypothetical protein
MQRAGSIDSSNVRITKNPLRKAQGIFQYCFYVSATKRHHR